MYNLCFHFWILPEMCHFLAHQFPSFILTFCDVWLMNSLNCSSTEQTYKNVPQDLKLWKYWPTSSTGMKPSFGSWNLLPWFGSKVVSLCKDIRMVFKWGLPNKTKVIITSHKIYKQIIIQVSRRSRNQAIGIMKNSVQSSE